jgi:hypothetical protein
MGEVGRRSSRSSPGDGARTRARGKQGKEGHDGRQGQEGQRARCDQPDECSFGGRVSKDGQLATIFVIEETPKIDLPQTFLSLPLHAKWTQPRD